MAHGTNIWPEVPRGIDYECNWGNEGRNDYGDRDYYGDRVQGSRYRGYGPRGYQRTDARIREDVCDALTEDAYIDASDLDVTVENSEVTLTGTVESRMQKRRAEDLAQSVAGVADVHNSLRVAGISDADMQRV